MNAHSYSAAKLAPPAEAKESRVIHQVIAAHARLSTLQLQPLPDAFVLATQQGTVCTAWTWRDFGTNSTQHANI
jgi:DNA/RNA-binding domain of Phe-tRNA-synthetase-like protein